MPTLNEMMGPGRKVPSFQTSTYSPLEVGLSSPSYQLNMTVSAKVDNLSSKVEKKLVTFMTNTLGYTKCVIDRRNNTIYVDSIDGVNSSTILRYIKKYVDSNAR